MPEYYTTKVWEDLFDRAQALSTTPGFNGWTVEETSSGGTPTYLIESGNGLVLTLVNTSEAEIVTAYHNDVLMFDVDDLHQVEMWVKVNGIDAVTTLVFGMADTQNDTADSVANHAWFRMEGSASTSLVVVETDDGTRDNNDKATGQTLSSTMKKFTIDFTNGTADVRFFIDGIRVAADTTFNMSAYTGQLQPFVQLQKASGTGVPDIYIRRWRITYAPAIS